MRKQPGYALLLILTVLCTLAALSTLMPQASVSKACFLGYRAHCSFTPFSTLICLVLASLFCKIRSKKFKSK